MLLSAIALPLLLTQTGKLEIKDTKIGTGLVAKVGDVVKVEYTGTLLNGKQFDSSVGRDPFQFQVGLGQVIKGWDQGIPGMKVGGSRTLVIPASLGYGDRGAGDAIPPKSTLKFTVKLLEVLPRSQVTVLKAGTGAGAKLGDEVSFNYVGKLKSGKEFDSSAKHGNAPMKLVIGQQVIPGLTQALFGVKKGEKLKVVIPSALAFGDRAVPPQDTENVKAGSIIPAKSDLVFDIEVLAVGAAN